jgi:replicative DNA helicase
MALTNIPEDELDGIFSPVPASASSDVLELRQAPHNLDVEQGLLGAILVNNGALHHLDDRLRTEHFYEPIHQKIYGAIQHFHDRGNIANPVTLKHYFSSSDTGEGSIGGDYLTQLAIAATMVIDVREYSEILYDLYLKRQIIDVGQTMVNMAYKQDMLVTARNQLEEAEQLLFNLAEHGDTGRNFQSFRVFGGNAVLQAERAFKRKGEVVGVSTGLIDLNKLLGGFQNSDLIILAGRPSMGKTALATTIAYKAALEFQREAEAFVGREDMAAADRSAKSVGFFSLEMSSEQLATRVLSARANISSSGIMRGELTDDEFSKLIQANTELSTLPFFIDDTPALSIAAVRTRARRLKRVHNVGLIIVDYLQLLTASTRNSNTNRVQEVSEITQGLKALAKELNVPVLALSQLSRAVESREDKRPLLSDLRESGSIEQDADVVMFVYREEYYLSRSKPDEGSPKFNEWQEAMERVYGKADAIIAKQRHGAIGTVTLQFFGEQTRFDDLADASHFPERFG